MITTLTAGFETPDMAGVALGKILRSGIPMQNVHITDAVSHEIQSGPWDPGDMRPGHHKTLFENLGDGDHPDPDVFSRGSMITIRTEEENCSVLDGILRNSGALGIRFEN